MPFFSELLEIGDWHGRSTAAFAVVQAKVDVQVTFLCTYRVQVDSHSNLVAGTVR